MKQFSVIARYSFMEAVTAQDLADLVELARASVQEPGNLGFEVLRPAGTSSEVVLLERYESPEAFENHRQSEHFRAIVLGRIIPRLRERTVETAALTPTF